MCHIRILRIFLSGFFIFVSQLIWSQTKSPLFKLLPSASTGVSFANIISENDTLNILNQANIYNGGGVGIGDFNNDGLVDIYLAGNMVANKFYLNKGSMKFVDYTTTAGVAGAGRWCTGVAVVDINADGRLDLYVSASFRKDPLLRTNLLYINQGINKDSVPVFKESAEEYGIADTGFSTQGYFFDYDKDGDLDLYLVTNELYDLKTPIRFRPKLVDGSALNTDRLYKNNGNGTFTNVSKEAGILIEGWGHAASISDFNMDGWPDVYVANDFVSNDLLYINNRDGTFTNRLAEYFKHTGWNAMGTDVVDINNDGLVDVISLEMLPEDNMRKKRMLSGNEYYNYFNSSQFDYEHQYVRNVLQLNSGNTPKGHPVFSDIGFMAGIYQTDWSWCPLVADFDNDGYRDMIITNGLPRDVTDLDWISYDNGQGGGKAKLSLEMTKSLPVVNIADYAFKNKGGILFENTTTSWGLNKSAFSNGSAYADLDNDGDLDFVVNNINDEAFIYENTINRKTGGEHILQIKLVGDGKNINGIGASIHLYFGGKQQYYQHYPTRGYLSTIDSRAHFGLGGVSTVDSIRVQWPEGKTQVLTNVKTDQLILISIRESRESGVTNAGRTANIQNQNLLFSPASRQYNILYKPVERDFIDYTIQATLPHKLSQYGPGIAVGDVDNNGFDDFYLGGTSGNPGVFFMQDGKGKFSLDSTRITRQPNELEEEMGVLFFDFDNDGDLDLYAVGGSYEVPPNHTVAQDRLFINDGKGKFEKSPDALPAETTNGSCVRAADFDKDGDLDLFVGGRVVSGAYPTNPQNFIFMNEAGKFVDVSQQVCPQLQSMGMVTDALWSDFDRDGTIDLVITGEWMPVTFLKNTGSSFVSINSTTGISQHLGWWNSLSSGDFDNDGDIDYVAGNLGLNSNYRATPKEPMTVYAKDLDNNSSLDLMLFCYMNAENRIRKPFPMHTRDDLASQLVSIRKRYPTYKAYGAASMDDLWNVQDRQGAIKKTANNLQSAYIENKGNGQFRLIALPIEAQSAPVYGMLSDDLDNDGNLDLLMVGNDYGMEPYSGRHDAFNGLCLKGDGKGKFNVLPLSETGFFVGGDAKGLAKIHTALSEDIWIATQNQDSLVVYNQTKTSESVNTKSTKLKPDDFYADIVYKDGKRRRVEFYYGSTYLSQSSRTFSVNKEMIKVTVTNYKGRKRELL